ncbi:MAG: sulfotransferase [Planctomycetota bacterium]
MTTQTATTSESTHAASTALPVMCVGGSPSSGSTLLADLLDSTPGLMCPPELYVLCVESAYCFDDAFRATARARQPFGVHAQYVDPVRFFNDKYAEHTGVTSAVLDDLLTNARDLREFMFGLAAQVGKHRSISPAGFVEKTPINVNCAPMFCHMFPEGVFVHIVRDGRDVCASLVRRGFTLYEAALIWMSQVHAGRLAAVAENAVEVRYEDLLERPFEIAADLGARVGTSVDPDDIQARLLDNTYRAGLPRIASWQVPEFSTEVRRAHTYKDRLSAKNIAWLESLALVQVGPNGMSHVIARFGDLLRQYNYVPDNESYDITLPLDRLLQCHGEFLRKSRNVTSWTDRALVMSSRASDWSATSSPVSVLAQSPRLPDTLRQAATVGEGQFAAETLQLLSFQIEAEQRENASDAPAT